MSCYMHPVGPLFAAIDDLSDGKVDLGTDAKNLTSALDSLLHNYDQREQKYAGAVKSIKETYDCILKEAGEIAAEMKAAAVQEAKGILNSARSEVEHWEAEKAMLADIQKFEPRIKLDVGGFKCTTSLTTLTRFPETMIGAMFSGRHALPLDEGGYHFIDRDGTHFRHILNFLRSPESFEFDLAGSLLKELKTECDYYGLLELMFPTSPVPEFAEFLTKNKWKESVTVQIGSDGIFGVNGVPFNVCKYCFTADYSMCGVVGHRGNTMSNFGLTANAWNVTLSLEQPQPHPCVYCGFP